MPAPMFVPLVMSPEGAIVYVLAWGAIGIGYGVHKAFAWTKERVDWYRLPGNVYKRKLDKRAKQLGLEIVQYYTNGLNVKLQHVSPDSLIPVCKIVSHAEFLGTNPKDRDVV